MHSISPHKRISYLRSIPNISQTNIAAKYIYYFRADETLLMLDHLQHWKVF
jgi:hypothetical protein